jgi:hypothetical protein
MPEGGLLIKCSIQDSETSLRKSILLPSFPHGAGLNLVPEKY